MKTGKLILAIVVMLILGAFGFWGLAALVEYRIGRPISTSVKPASVTRREPRQVLEEGLREALETAAASLKQQDRSRAVTALDDAKRVAEVGSEALTGHFAMAYDAIQRARLSIQNGDAGKAWEIVTEVLAHLSNPDISNQESAQAGTSSASSFNNYQGATVLNAHGVRIGEIDRVAGNRAVVIVGGKRDVLGFIDLPGGHRLEVRFRELILGKPKNLGSTMVVLPTLSVSPQQIEEDVMAALH